MAVAEYNLPRFTTLKIDNMTTFQQDIRILFGDSIHVIFGGNHSGKTTIVNSLKYGVFGLSSSTLPEDLDKRYFVSRIREIGRKSLEINAIYTTSRKGITTNRTVFTSGTADISSLIVDNSGFLDSPQNIQREKEYNDVLKVELGNMTDEELDFISQLIFADENRKTILWSKSLQKIVIRLLSSPEKRNELKLLETTLEDVETELSKLKQDFNQKDGQFADNKRYLKYLQQSLKEIDVPKLKADEKIFEDTKRTISECKKSLSELRLNYEQELKLRRGLSDQIKTKQTYISQLTKNLENLKGEYLGAFMQSTTSDVYHVGNYVYHKKQCPVCFADISPEISGNLEKRKCPLCGKNELAVKRNMPDIDKQMSELESQIEALELDLESTEKTLVICEQAILSYDNAINEKQRFEDNAKKKLEEFAALEEDLHKRDLLLRQLEHLSNVIKSDNQIIKELNEEIEKKSTEITRIRESQRNKERELYTETTTRLSVVRQNFLSFVDTASNNELKADLSAELTPTLNGRTIFNADTSLFERTLLDYAFRVAFLSVLADKTNTKPSLVLETPDEVADESYIPYIAKAINRFSDKISFIITTYNTELMRNVLSSYTANEKGRHFTDLISKGTLTQRKYYEPNLIGFSGKN